MPHQNTKLTFVTEWEKPTGVPSMPQYDQKTLKGWRTSNRTKLKKVRDTKNYKLVYETVNYHYQSD